MPLHTTAAEHFEKLRRVRGRLDAEVHKDDLGAKPRDFATMTPSEVGFGPAPNM
jgi:hypothetical protein